MWLFLANQIALLTLLKNWVYWHWSWNQNMSIHSGIMVVVVFSDEQAYFDMAYIILDISKLFRPKCGFYLLYLDSSQQIDCKYLNFFLWMILSRKKYMSVVLYSSFSQPITKQLVSTLYIPGYTDARPPKKPKILGNHECSNITHHYIQCCLPSFP